MLGALFYPKGTKQKPIDFDSLFIPYIYKEIYLDGIYIDIFNQKKKEMVVVDVGANIGIVTQYMRPFAKKLYAIEPSPEHFEALKTNKTWNHWDETEIFNLAIADKDGEMTLNFNNANRTCNSLSLDYGQGGVKVKTMAMDTFFKKNKIKEVDFMKFDVEGAEETILRSTGFIKVAPQIKNIMVEFHFPTWQALVEHMIKLGYTARRYDCSAIVILFSR